MMFLKRVFVFIMVLAAGAATAQVQNKPIGYWTSYFCYTSAMGVATDGNELFVAGAQAFFTYKATSNSAKPEAYSKVEGMSDIGMTCIGYDGATGTAVLVYANGNIDLFKDNTFYNIPDLKIKTIAGTKEVYEVFTENGKAYLSSSLGVLVIDIASHDILATYQFLNESASSFEVMGVKAFRSSGAYFYAATTGGLYRVAKTNPQLQNYKVWQRIDTAAKVVYMADVADTLFFANSKKVYRLSADTLKPVYGDTALITHIDGGYTRLYISENRPSKIKVLDISNTLVDSFKVLGLPVQVVQLLDSTIWIADKVGGIEKRQPDNSMSYYGPTGPIDAGTFDITVNNGDLWIAHGGFTDAFYAKKNYAGVANFNNGKWKYYTQYVYQPFDTLSDFVTIAKDENTGTIYTGSFLDGLSIIRPDGSYEQVKQNSIFDTSVKYYHAGQRDVAGTTIDKDGNVWVTLMYSQHQLYARTTDSVWHKFYIPNAEYAGPVVVDDNGQVWYVCYYDGGRGGGVVVYNHNNTIADPSDDASYHLSSGVGYGNLPSNVVYCIAKDRNNAIWVGTANGIGIVNNCSLPVTVSAPCDAQIPIVQYDQYAGYLFAGSNVRAIAVDGANRKWVGTDNGVWLLSPDANSIISRFTVDNSPLPTNVIRKIAIDQVTGDVYIGTDVGLVSFHGTATEGGTANDNVSIFPNPVPGNFTGTIAIRGLVENADVRITDINGQMVFRTKALGGQAVWNGKDYKGHRPQSGVYLIFASNSDGTQVWSGKIVFLQ